MATQPQRRGGAPKAAASKSTKRSKKAAKRTVKKPMVKSPTARHTERPQQAAVAPEQVSDGSESANQPIDPTPTTNAAEDQEAPAPAPPSTKPRKFDDDAYAAAVYVNGRTAVLNVIIEAWTGSAGDYHRSVLSLLRLFGPVLAKPYRAARQELESIVQQNAYTQPGSVRHRAGAMSKLEASYERLSARALEELPFQTEGGRVRQPTPRTYHGRQTIARASTASGSEIEKTLEAMTTAPVTDTKVMALDRASSGS